VAVLLAGLFSGLAVVWLSIPAVSAEGNCTQTRQGEPLSLAPLLHPANPIASDPSLDYRHRLHTTALGWPVQSSWCVWVEPGEQGEGGQPSATTLRWLEAVNRALVEWNTVLPIQRAPLPEQAQVTLWRRRPPLAQDPAGRPRASHGRAILSLRSQGSDLSRRVEHRVEPRVEVLISPGQRLEAIQATALHELGHAFGLWGHSEDPGDAMAVAPGSRPILHLSPRDRATVRWLYAQPSPMRSNP